MPVLLRHAWNIHWRKPVMWPSVAAKSKLRTNNPQNSLALWVQCIALLFLFPLYLQHAHAQTAAVQIGNNNNYVP